MTACVRCMSCDCHVTAVKVGREYMSEKAAAMKIEPFKPRSGVTIHTNDEEAKEAEMQGGSKPPTYCTGEPPNSGHVGTPYILHRGTSE